jgi:hypothetical protein
MQHNEIHVGHKYRARVRRTMRTVRVEAIREIECGRYLYDVLVMGTGAKQTFDDPARFRNKLSGNPLPPSTPIRDALLYIGEKLPPGTTLIHQSEVKQPEAPRVPETKESEKTMAENNESPKRLRITHRQFFKICEELRNRRETILAEKPTQGQLAKIIGETLKMHVGIGTIREACEEIGLEWAPVIKRAGQNATEKKHRMRVLGRAIVTLFRQLGMQPPDDLLDLLQVMYGENRVPNDCRKDYVPPSNK